ncbi:MAG: FecR domain-containing protein [Bacteroidales bacterium]|nr:FecR domain-containing protein [Bacteroidales bacterium]MDD2426099.1 FecR domain-containing protein [Bacteroidales bacterium]MDD3990343.1 FecR domain-containing protein [Bacteroidales bacterium]MDD4639560.1 FecR domain-containing protein [Bacteroidales bacterium]
MKRITYLMQRFFEGKADKEEQQEFMRLVNNNKFDRLFLKAWERLLKKNLESGEEPDEKLTAIVQDIRKRFNLKDYEYIRTLSESQNSDASRNSNENKIFEPQTSEPQTSENQISEHQISKNQTFGTHRIIHSNHTRRRFILWSAAAAILILISVTYFTKNYFIRENQSSLSQTLIEPGIKGATLILDDGTVVPLSDTTKFSLREKDGTLIQKESGNINYTSQDRSKAEKEIFNTIITSTGEEYTLQLSDGSLIHLNAESEVRFPVKFVRNSREVSVKGEAYFVVAKDAARPFTAKTTKMNVRVLGTQFNITAYEGENSVRATLVEGSLEVSSLITKNTLVIMPGQQASIGEPGELEIKNVDTKLYTDWIDGKFIFVNERLEDIIIKLRRWYNIEVEYADESVKDIRFGARLNRYTQVNTIFEIMNNTRLVNIVQTKNKFMIRPNR